MMRLSSISNVGGAQTGSAVGVFMEAPSVLTIGKRATNAAEPGTVANHAATSAMRQAGTSFGRVHNGFGPSAKVDGTVYRNDYSGSECLKMKWLGAIRF